MSQIGQKYFNKLATLFFVLIRGFENEQLKFSDSYVVKTFFLVLKDFKSAVI